MNTTVTIDLNRLPSLADLFAQFNAGKHLNRVGNHSLWAELEREQAQYEALFAALGYALKIDGRGFAWFHVEESSQNVSKTTRQLALLLMLIFEFKADAGVHLAKFTDWVIDQGLFDALIEKNEMLLKAENLADVESLAQVMRAASNYGFATADQGGWRLLPAVFRYLDRFEELARKAPDEPGDDEVEEAEL
ncbi:hypothetical protein CEW87_13990 [Parazoarcus communis]|uniref:DUF4194 domain-containing protein n=1 Tax=Parazoarcus communis TaxID=41977 RepID=A0A2U8H351_9RHOO|nr:hypothetical protein [Parazoarcus communis]AWI80372.1 hypothetical protein CEW87_13990 [Parazoarcus communis]